MKVLHVVNIYFVLPFYLGDQIQYLNEKGHEIHIICSPSELIKDFAKKQNCNYAEVPVLKSIDIRQDLISLFRIIKYIKKHKIEMVVGHTPKGALLAMLAACFLRVHRRVYFRHALIYETMQGLKRKLFISIEKFTSACSTKIVAVSPSIFDRSIEDKLNKKSKMVVIGKGTCGGIDTRMKFNPQNIDQKKKEELRSRLGLTDKDLVIGYTGRLVKDKGIVELIDAFQLLNNKNNRKLLLVGDFEERDSLSELDKLHIKNNPNIILTGFIFQDIEYYYSLMDIFILPSYREGFGMSVLEASAMEIPVFVTNVTGLKDAIVENKTGLFINRNPEEMKDAIEKALNNIKTKELGINGRKWVSQHFDHQILWPLIEKELYL